MGPIDGMIWRNLVVAYFKVDGRSHPALAFHGQINKENAIKKKMVMIIIMTVMVVVT
jgi:hypothetical protein